MSSPEIPEEAFCSVGLDLWNRDGGSEFVDPLTYCVMTDPVTAMDGITYERHAITTWCENCGEAPVSPVTREVLMDTTLTPNKALRKKMLKAKKKQAVIAAEEFAASAGSTSSGTDNADMHNNVVTISELNRIFSHLDPVRPVLDRTLSDWRQPQIVVVGQESSGKSSLLERISMMSIFPRLADDALDEDGQPASTCTRVRIELQLRNSVEQHIPKLQVIDSETREPISGFEEPMLIPAHNGHIDVRREMDKLLAGVQGPPSDVYISNRIITLRVSGPQVPSIDLVDLPGIRQTGGGSDSTKSMVHEHITANANRSLFLFVMRAGEVKANYSALAVAEAHQDKVLTNSIGVLTMLDMLSQKAISKSMKQVMTGDDNLFKRYGWVATMNALPEGDEGEAFSGFQRLQKQARLEQEFFEEMKWEKKEQLTTNHLIGHLNLMFKDYVKETWMPGAVKKLLARLDQIDYERLKLGIVTDSPLSQQESAAAQEVERRLGVTLKPMRDAFNFEVLHHLRVEVDAYLTSPELSVISIKNEHVNSTFASISMNIKAIVASAIAKIPNFWTDKLHETLTTETKEDSSGGTGTFSLNTFVSSLGVSLPVIGAMASRMLLYTQTKKMTDSAAAFIQLSQYTQYTDEIKVRCEDYISDFQTRVEKNASVVVDRLMDYDSPWIDVIPDPTSKCESVNLKVHSFDFQNALVAAFVREYPLDEVFMSLHKDVDLGSECVDARAKLEQLNKDYSDVERAVKAIKEAFEIKKDEEEELRACADW